MKYIKQNKTFLEKWLKTWKFLIKLLIIIIFLLSFHKNFDLILIKELQVANKFIVTKIIVGNLKCFNPPKN